MNFQEFKTRLSTRLWDIFLNTFYVFKNDDPKIIDNVKDYIASLIEGIKVVEKEISYEDSSHFIIYDNLDSLDSDNLIFFGNIIGADLKLWARENSFWSYRQRHTIYDEKLGEYDTTFKKFYDRFISEEGLKSVPVMIRFYYEEDKPPYDDYNEDTEPFLITKEERQRIEELYANPQVREEGIGYKVKYNMPDLFKKISDELYPRIVILISAIWSYDPNEDERFNNYKELLTEKDQYLQTHNLMTLPDEEQKDVLLPSIDIYDEKL